MATRKPRKEPTVKFAIFSECAKLEKTPFWKAKFEEFSKGQFPKGFTYRDKVLSYKRLRRKALQKIDIPNDPAEAAVAVKTFMRSETGTIPTDELIKKRIEMTVALKQNLVPDDQKWKDIRAPTVKRQMITAYVYDCVKSGKLGDSDARNLTSVIVSGLSIKAIKPEDIVLKDGKIVDIGGIDYDERGFFLISVPEICGTISSKVVKVSKQTSGDDKWEKIHQQYENYIQTGSAVK